MKLNKTQKILLAFIAITGIVNGQALIDGVNEIITAKNIGNVTYAEQYSIGSTTGGIQEALNALPAGHNVVKYSGNAVVTGITVSVSNVTIDLSGAYLTLANGANAPMFSVSGNNVRFVGGEIDGNKANQVSGVRSGIRALNVLNLTVEEMNIHDFYNQGIDIVGTSASVISANNIVRHNNLHNNGMAGVYMGFYTQDSIIDGNICSNNGGTSPNTDDNGITIGDWDHDITVSNNVCNNNQNVGIDVDDQLIESNITIIGNIANYNAVAGILSQNSQGNTIVGNSIQAAGVSSNCILVSKSNYTSLTGNTCSKAAFDGVKVVNSYGVSITSGNIRYAQNNGLSLVNANFTSVTGVNFFNNGQATDATYGDIFITYTGGLGSFNNTILANTMYAQNGAKRTKFGILEDVNADYNMYAYNNMRGQSNGYTFTQGTHNHLDNNSG